MVHLQIVLLKSSAYHVHRVISQPYNVIKLLWNCHFGVIKWVAGQIFFKMMYFVPIERLFLSYS